MVEMTVVTRESLSVALLTYELVQKKVARKVVKMVALLVATLDE